MKPLFLHNHTLSSALERLFYLLCKVGVTKTLSVCVSIIEEDFLKCFDRIYRVKTSGYIPVSTTSGDRSKRLLATGYGPVNAWAFRRVLKNLDLPKKLRFVDLGCGLGRPCILAAEYGFAKVTGVDIVQQFCALAQENISRCRLPACDRTSVNIVHGDVLDYCEQTEDDVFFMYRPFQWELFCVVLKNLIEKANGTKSITIIYTERFMLPDTSYAKAFSEYQQSVRKIYEANSMGHTFYVYQTVPH